MMTINADELTKKVNEKNECPEPRGILLIIGGKENKGEDGPEEKKKPEDFIKLEVLSKFRDLMRRKNGLVEIITSASGEGKEMFNDYKKVFKKVGIENVQHIHHHNRKEVLDDDMGERLQKADAFFFTGGDQLKLTSLYGGTPILTVLKQRYINERVVVAGTSAGAMALSTPMIYAGNKAVQELGGEIKVTTGLEFLKDVCIDTHFVHRGRFVRMAQVVVTNPTCIGLGIEEDTAVVLNNGNDCEVIGSGNVIIIEGFFITSFDVEEFTKDRPVTIRDLKVHILASGDKYLIKQYNPPHK